jgi:hypothetical protein
MVVADEHHLSVIYYVQNIPENWDGTSARVVGPTAEGEPYAIVSFVRQKAYYHGSPNDEAFSGHPLSKRGLTPYGAFEIKNSTWIRQLMEMNRVHPHHKDESFSACRHFVLSFHDSTFECVASSYSLKTGSGSILSAARSILDDWK